MSTQFHYPRRKRGDILASLEPFLLLDPRKISLCYFCQCQSILGLLTWHFLEIRLTKQIDSLINRLQMNVCCWYNRLFSLISELSREMTLVWEDWTPRLQGSHSLKPVMKPGSPYCKEPPTTQNYFIILALREAWTTKCCITGFPTLTSRRRWQKKTVAAHVLLRQRSQSERQVRVCCRPSDTV